MAERWYKERGAWVSARAGRWRGAQRRAERLLAAARRHEREEAGLGDAALRDVVTPNVVHRSVFREEGALNTAGWAVFTAAWVFWALVLAGPAWLLAWALFQVWMARIDKLGVPRVGPAVLGAAAVAAAGFMVGLIVGPHSAGMQLLAGYLLAQIVFGLLHLGWLSRAYGWPAVQKKLRARSGSVEALEIPQITVPEDDGDTAEIPVQQEQVKQEPTEDLPPQFQVEIITPPTEGAAR